VGGGAGWTWLIHYRSEPMLKKRGTSNKNSKRIEENEGKQGKGGGEDSG